MKGKSICECCKSEFEWKRTESQISIRGIPKFCSHSCRAKIKQKTSAFSWDSLNEQECVERLKRSLDKKVVKKNGCWDWTSSIQAGYGAIRYKGKYIGAHRASWIIHNGEIPSGLCVCHKCDNKLCTNPEHLFLGTFKENSEDREKKGRGIKGAKVSTSTLKEHEVIEIRQKLCLGLSSVLIAKQYNVSAQAIYHIKWNKFWKWLK